MTPMKDVYIKIEPESPSVIPTMRELAPGTVFSVGSTMGIVIASSPVLSRQCRDGSICFFRLDKGNDNYVGIVDSYMPLQRVTAIHGMFRGFKE